MSRDYSQKLQERNQEELQRQNLLLKAKVIELETELEELKHERKFVNKQVQQMRESRQELLSNFDKLKIKNSQTLQEMNELFTHKDKQIGIITTQKMVAEEKCRGLEEIARKANTRISVLMKELTDRQEFITECLRKEDMGHRC